MPWLIHLADQACLIMGIGYGTDGLSYHGLDEAMSRFGFTNKDFEEAMTLLFAELDSARTNRYCAAEICLIRLSAL